MTLVDADVRMYSVQQLADLWDCGRTFLYAEIKAGRLLTVDIGDGRSKLRVSAADAQAWIEQRRTASAAH